METLFQNYDPVELIHAFALQHDLCSLAAFMEMQFEVHADWKEWCDDAQPVLEEGLVVGESLDDKWEQRRQAILAYNQLRCLEQRKGRVDGARRILKENIGHAKEGSKLQRHLADLEDALQQDFGKSN